MRLGLGIDPGKRRAGGCLYSVDDRVIIAAGLITGLKTGEGPLLCAALARNILTWVEEKSGRDALAVEQLVTEWPRTYGGKASKGDGSDLFYLSGLDCALAAMLPGAEIIHYEPREWKGTIEKPDTVEEEYPIKTKVERRLSPEEAAVVEWTKNVRHSWDVTDAAGISLTAMGRFEKIRNYPKE